MAVKNPCGLKKPVIQKQFGRPSKIQAWNWRFRSSSSVYQNPRVLEAQDAWDVTWEQMGPVTSTQAERVPVTHMYLKRKSVY